MGRNECPSLHFTTSGSLNPFFPLPSSLVSHDGTTSLSQQKRSIASSSSQRRAVCSLGYRIAINNSSGQTSEVSERWGQLCLVFQHDAVSVEVMNVLHASGSGFLPEDHVLAESTSLRGSIKKRHDVTRIGSFFCSGLPSDFRSFCTGRYWGVKVCLAWPQLIPSLLYE